MKLVLDKKHGNRIEFLAEGLSLAFANMLRRYSISRVPVLAVDHITFYDNNSAMWDEYLAHRLGLIPLTTPENLPENVGVVLTLDSEGPGTVYSGDMKSSDKEISVGVDDIPFVTLGSDQRVRLEGYASLGTGKKHAKFQAGIVSYGEEKDKLRFMVESFYQMQPYEILKRSCDVLEKDIEDVEAALGAKPKKAKKTAAKKSTAKKKTTKKKK
ncbi:DNA-directed RNA polymerase subunit D [Candidatus Micrarchaeota archaeon]|nr:DNA-directed RNA polymerase subunit D [Candidatus Micrarchaeota archaeon]